MPGFNQTGPKGQGAMTGRRMGRCSNSRNTAQNQSAESKDNSIEKTSDDFQGRGFGRGRGRGGQGLGMGRQNRSGN